MSGKALLNGKWDEATCVALDELCQAATAATDVLNYDVLSSVLQELADYYGHLYDMQKFGIGVVSTVYPLTGEFAESPEVYSKVVLGKLDGTEK